MPDTKTGHVMPTYRRSPLQFVRGQGAWLETADGETYLDFAAGIAANVLGHAHPKLVAALTQQAQSLWHVSNLYTIKEQEAFAAALCAESFADYVFFCNSGAEAVEGAIKAARKYHSAQGQLARVNIITFAGAFHGRTLATLAAGSRAHDAGFGPLPQGFVSCAAFDMQALTPLVDANTAAILLEPIQGEGGVREAGTAFLRDVRALCDAHGILLIVDEVQCGVGRTGKLFAHQWAEIAPDIMALAKGLAGGFPIGAVLASQAVGRVMQAGTHGSTFGGNPLAMAVGMAVLEEVATPAFLDHVQAVGIYLRQKLAELTDHYPDILAGVRGQGLMVGIETKCENTAFVDALRAQKLLSVAASDNVVRFLPPLNIDNKDIRIAVAAIEAACHRLQMEQGLQIEQGSQMEKGAV